jgi:alpha-galactosidase
MDVFDDGHRPGNTVTCTRIVRHDNKNQCKFGAVFDDCLPDHWCRRAYDYATYKGRPWGVYIQTSEAIDESINPEDIWNSDNSGDKEKALGLIATRSLIFSRGKDIIGKDVSSLHGTVVWCLSSDSNSSVEYHIDYAELFRYETNIIVPPLYAGTCHVSPVKDGEMKGGEFTYNMGGLDHYQRFGYKSRLVSADDKEQDSDSNEWVKVRYKCNRGILHDGDFPHASTRVEQIPDGVKRVILGFNCFTDYVGDCCIRAPEHSDAFNRTIKLYQAMASLSNPLTSSSVDKKESRISAKEVMKNPALARMLVLAAKKIKSQQEMKQEMKEKLETL